MNKLFKNTLERYDELIDLCDGIIRKGKTVPYTSDQGHMFTLLNKEGVLGIRFDKKRQENYFKKYSTTYLMSHGAKMQGYIKVTDEMLKDTDLMLRLITESHAYVCTLPPK